MLQCASVRGVTWGWNTGTAACCPCGCVSISMVLGAWSRTPLRITQTKQDSRLDDVTLIIGRNKSRPFPFKSTIKFYSNVEQCSFCSIKLTSDGCPGVEFQQSWNLGHVFGYDTLCLGPSQVAPWPSFGRDKAAWHSSKEPFLGIAGYTRYWFKQFHFILSFPKKI